MTRDGEDIFEYPLSNTIDPGISWWVFPGMVSEIEEREAATFGGYTWKEWKGLEHQEKVDGVAYFRIRRQIDMHQQDAQYQESERQRRRAQRK